MNNINFLDLDQVPCHAMQLPCILCRDHCASVKGGLQLSARHHNHQVMPDQCHAIHAGTNQLPEATQIRRLLQQSRDKVVTAAADSAVHVAGALATTSGCSYLRSRSGLSCRAKPVRPNLELYTPAGTCHR